MLARTSLPAASAVLVGDGLDVGRVDHDVNRDQLLDITRGRAANLFDRSIDNQVSRLRRKIEDDPKEPKIIQTIWGGGYKFVGVVERL